MTDPTTNPPPEDPTPPPCRLPRRPRPPAPAPAAPAPSAPAAPSSMTAARPTGITILAVLAAIGGVFGLLGGFGVLFVGGVVSSGAVVVLGLVRARLCRAPDRIRLRRLDAASRGPGPLASRSPIFGIVVAILQVVLGGSSSSARSSASSSTARSCTTSTSPRSRRSSDAPDRPNSRPDVAVRHDPPRRFVTRVRTAARGSPASPGEGNGNRPAASSASTRRRVARTSARDSSPASVVAEVAVERRRGSARARRSRPAASGWPRQPHSTVRSFGTVEKHHPVVDAVDVPPAVDRQDVAALAVGVVHGRVEDGHPAQPRVVLDDHRDDVDRRVDVDPTPGPCPRRTARRAGSSAGRCPSRSPRDDVPGRHLAAGQRAVGEVVERPLAERSACRSPRRRPVGSGSGQTRVTVHEHRVVRRPDDPADDLDLALAQDLERRRRGRSRDAGRRLS